MIKNLRNEIKKLKDKILFLGLEVENNLRKAEKALLACSCEIAHEVVEKDNEIDRIEIEVEEKCLQILAQHQPVAGDLRLVVTVLKIDNDLERIGDLAVKIADRVRLLTDAQKTDLLSNMPTINNEFRGMFKDTVNMLKMSLDSFVEEDADLAYKVCLIDEEIDEAKDKIRSQLEQLIYKDPTTHPHLALLLSVSRSLERIADHATKIAENVIYMLQGDIVRHEIE